MTNPSKQFEKTFQKWQNFRKDQIAYSDQLKADIISKLPAVLTRYQVKKAYLFGSVLTKHATEESDIDLLVSPLEKRKFWDLKFELEQMLGIAVDLHSDDEDPVLVEKICNRGELIYEA